MTVSPIKRIGVSALAVAALSLTACGGSAASGGGSSGSGSASGSGTPSETLTIGYDSDPAPQGYDPLLYAGGQRLFYESLYQSLFVQTASGGVAPGLVTSFSYNAKKTQMTLKLKSGVTFTDGSDADRTARQGEPGPAQQRQAPVLRRLRQGRSRGDHQRHGPGRQHRRADLRRAAGHLPDQAGRRARHDHRPARPSATRAACRPPPTARARTRWQSAVTGSSYTMTRKAGTAAATYPYTTIVYKPFLDKAARVNAQISGQTDVSILDADHRGDGPVQRRLAGQERRHRPDAADLRQDRRQRQGVR